VDGDFVMLANWGNNANSVFDGLIDWIMWQSQVNYSVVDGAA
jgi:hypothetical protein